MSVQLLNATWTAAAMRYSVLSPRRTDHKVLDQMYRFIAGEWSVPVAIETAGLGLTFSLVAYRMWWTLTQA